MSSANLNLNIHIATATGTPWLGPNRNTAHPRVNVDPEQKWRRNDRRHHHSRHCEPQHRCKHTLKAVPVSLDGV
jgi:hypothetical protein